MEQVEGIESDQYFQEVLLKAWDLPENFFQAPFGFRVRAAEDSETKQRSQSSITGEVLSPWRSPQLVRLFLFIFIFPVPQDSWRLAPQNRQVSPKPSALTPPMGVQ